MLRSLIDQDASWLVEAKTSWHGSIRWKHREPPPGLRVIDGLMWDDVELQAVCVDDELQPRCLLQVCRVDLRNGHAHLDLLVRPDVHSTPETSREIRGFVHLTFQTLPLRKLYVQILQAPGMEPDLALGSEFAAEGRLVGHEYGYDGALLDLVWYARARSAVEDASSDTERCPKDARPMTGR